MHSLLPMVRIIKHLRTGVQKLFAKAKDAKSFLRLKPFDQSTPEGCTNERHRRIALASVALALSRGTGLAVAFLSFRLTFHYLGIERYELWMTLNTTIAMLSFADLGIGGGLLNLIARAYGRNDSAEAARAVASAFSLLSCIACFLAILWGSVFWIVPWARLFNVQSPLAVAELPLALNIFFGCFLANLVLSVVTRVQIGYQDGFVNSLWQIAGNVLATLGLLAGIRFHAGLPMLILALTGAPVLTTIGNCMVLFCQQRPAIFPRWSNVSRETVVLLGRSGFFFFLLQGTFAVAFLSDNLIAKRLLPTGAVTDYSSVSRLFTIAPMVMEMFLAPLWPAYGEATVRGDTEWIKKTLLRSLMAASVFAAFSALVLLIFGKKIVQHWISPEVSPPFFLLLGWAVWSVCSTAGNAVAMFLNGGGAIRFQAVCAVIMATVALVLKLFLVRRLGLPGIIWGTILSYGLFTALPMAVYVPRLLEKLKRSHSGSGEN